ncbi:alpha-2-HS-glycoprotein [Erinaceus europaeus]|uniref:Alpha-2-HS-glycoprotein n=1 Tax=Erinaceus europaeus TaxID=9365 RepID=A0A1S3W6U1_ERIEU|nr:alpha-2-HS-glycoprotein [Erinaceus europaeus]
MKFLVLLLCLVQLWTCQAVPLATDLGYRQPNCDDPETEQVAQVAIDYLNSNVLWGYKHTLNQIDKVKVWPRRPMGEVYELEIDTLETTCYALDPTPLANCSVRQLAEHAVEGDCDFHVLKMNGQLTVLFAKCHSSPDSAEDVLKVCPNCPLLALLNDTHVVHAVDVALKTFNAQSNGSYYKLVETSRGQRVLLPPSTYVEFAVAATDCAAKDVTDPANCNLLSEKQYGFCKATVFEKVGGEDVEVACTLFQAQPQPGAMKEAGPTTAVDLAETPRPPVLGAQMVGAWLVGAKMAGPPQGVQVHRAHYDLRDTFAGVPSHGSGSFETLDLKKKHEVRVTVGGSAGFSPCPGRIRHFKV